MVKLQRFFGKSSNTDTLLVLEFHTSLRIRIRTSACPHCVTVCIYDCFDVGRINKLYRIFYSGHYVGIVILQIVLVFFLRQRAFNNCRINQRFIVGRQRTGIQYYVNSVYWTPPMKQTDESDRVNRA